MRGAIQECRGCDLWEDATQAVMGEGARNASVVLVYKARGKRRIHQKPDRWQVSACLPWLHAELRIVRPEALVCLGATAAQALLGSQIRIGRDRGTPIESELAELVAITAHPSSILRARSDEERHDAMDEFVTDLRGVAAWLSKR